MICASCGCGCRILPARCLYDRNSRLKAVRIEDKPEITDAVDSFVLRGSTGDGLLGFACFEQLCKAIKDAQKAANEYKQNNAGANDEQAEFWYWLPENWNELLNNRDFQAMYAAYALFYYYHLGYAAAETTLDGDVKHTRNGNLNQADGTKNIEYKESHSQSAIYRAAAYNYFAVFVNSYWKHNKHKFSCLPPKTHCPPAKHGPCIDCGERVKSDIKTPYRPSATAI